MKDKPQWAYESKCHVTFKIPGMCIQLALVSVQQWGLDTRLEGSVNIRRFKECISKRSAACRTLSSNRRYLSGSLFT
jgi:hypothetical protein